MATSTVQVPEMVVTLARRRLRRPHSRLATCLVISGKVVLIKGVMGMTTRLITARATLK